jgi:hypothetical protein
VIELSVIQPETLVEPVVHSPARLPLAAPFLQFLVRT